MAFIILSLGKAVPSVEYAYDPSCRREPQQVSIGSDRIACSKDSRRINAASFVSQLAAAIHAHGFFAVPNRHCLHPVEEQANSQMELESSRRQGPDQAVVLAYDGTFSQDTTEEVSCMSASDSKRSKQSPCPWDGLSVKVGEILRPVEPTSFSSHS